MPQLNEGAGRARRQSRPRQRPYLPRSPACRNVPWTKFAVTEELVLSGQRLRIGGAGERARVVAEAVAGGGRGGGRSKVLVCVIDLPLSPTRNDATSPARSCAIREQRALCSAHRDCFLCAFLLPAYGHGEAATYRCCQFSRRSDAMQSRSFVVAAVLCCANKHVDLEPDDCRGPGTNCKDRTTCGCERTPPTSRLQSRSGILPSSVITKSVALPCCRMS